MNYAEENGLPEISEVTSRVEDRVCTLRWRWPDGVQAVCIRKAPAEETDDSGSPPPGLRLYTREEYKANNGYHDRLDEIGLVAYTVYVRLETPSGVVLVRQRNEHNRIVVSAGKARIFYSIQYKRALFQKRQSVHMQIRAEVPVPKEALCYVKKKGGIPAGKEDGTLYPFVRDFDPGRNELPPVEIGREDRIRIFFTDGPKYGRFFELVPE